MKKRLILFKGAYDTLDIFMTEFQIQFEKLGNEIMVFHTKDFADGLLRLSEFARFPVDAMITFNNLGLNFEFEAGRNLWNDLKIPCIDILVDHPFHYHEALVQAPDNCTVVCMDKKHTAYVKRFYPNIKSCHFLAHGGTVSPNILPWESREIDVFYAGGLSRSFARQLIPKSEDVGNLNVKLLGREVMDFLVSNPQYTTEDVLEQYLISRQIILPDDTLRLLISRFRYIDSLVVSFFREKSVKVLVENGIHVHLCGNGWDACNWIQNPNVTYRQRIAPMEIFRLMGNSKIILNTMTWFKAGCHDRIFNAMLSKGISLTDSSEYIDKNFQNGKELISFQLNQMDVLPDLARHWLSHPEESKSLTDTAFETAVSRHTWPHRAVELLEFIL